MKPVVDKEVGKHSLGPVELRQSVARADPKLSGIVLFHAVDRVHRKPVVGSVHLKRLVGRIILSKSVGRRKPYTAVLRLIDRMDYIAAENLLTGAA